VVERRVAEEEQLLPGEVAEAADDVVQPVDRDRRTELLERGRGDLACEAREPRVERVDAVLVGRDERVRGDERLEVPPEQISVDYRNGRTRRLSASPFDVRGCIVSRNLRRDLATGGAKC
jgi:hypothetical protein